jgi:RHS repeat-associated protein
VWKSAPLDAGKIAASSSGTVTNSFRYTGRDFDLETGLCYYRAQYYDPTIGRFISEDPIGFGGGTNHYAYQWPYVLA